MPVARMQASPEVLDRVQRGDHSWFRLASRRMASNGCLRLADVRKRIIGILARTPIGYVLNIRVLSGRAERP